MILKTLFGLMATGLALEMAPMPQADNKSESGPLKVVVHVNFAESGN
jgi:intracellular sulfur oxidation DsrE/DsrF family protein